MTTAEAIKKGILEDRVVFLKPVPRASKNGVKDPNHIAFWKMKDSVDGYCLKKDEKTGRIINPFNGGKNFTAEDQIKYFSEVKSADLNPYTSENKFWGEYRIIIIKTPELMNIGKKFDLSNPSEMLDYLVLKTWKKEFSSDWESRMNGDFKYAFVDSDYEEKKTLTEFDFAIKLGEVIGQMKDSPKKMRDFLNIYYQEHGKSFEIPEDFKSDSLILEMKKIIDIDRAGFVALADDEIFSTKSIICAALDRGSIKREGVGTYTISGLDVSYTYRELVAQMVEWGKDSNEPIYAKIIASNNRKK